MRYLSTRGGAAAKGFSEVLLAGLAEDGGLFMPAGWPQLTPHNIARFAGRPYHDVAYGVISPFVGADVPDSDLRRILKDTYAKFPHPAVAPLRQLGPDLWALELFH